MMKTEPTKAHGNLAAATSISIPPIGEEAQISLSSVAGGLSITGAPSSSGSTGAPGTASSPAVAPVAENRLILRHGSSLALIANVCSFLADPGHSDNFSYIDPNGDQGKWKRKGMELYYCAVMDPTTNSILCATRCATQGLMSSGNLSGGDDGDSSGGNDIAIMPSGTKKRRRRLLIDYLYTIESARDKGIARRVISFLLNRAQEVGAYSYVLSLEDSAVYWMEKWGFYLCEDAKLNGRLNVFPDTHLLRLGSDPKDEILPEEAADHDRCRQRKHSDEGGENTSPNGGSGTTTTTTTTTTDGIITGNGGDNGTAAAPPEAFTSALTKLLAVDPPNAPSDELKLCLTSLSILLKNAMAEKPGGRRRRIRIANPNVRQRVFAVGGDHAMAVLQCAGFELGVDEEGDTTLTFHDGANKWLAVAVGLLEKKASGGNGTIGN